MNGKIKVLAAEPSLSQDEPTNRAIFVLKLLFWALLAAKGKEGSKKFQENILAA